MTEFVRARTPNGCQICAIKNEGDTTISASVGVGGKNLPADVVTIQELLNNIPPERGGPVPPLVVDGICGLKTTGAILRFQKTQKLAWTDGRVDTNGPTLARLLEEQPDDAGAGGGIFAKGEGGAGGSKASKSLTFSQGLRIARGRRSLPIVKRCIKKALLVLDGASLMAISAFDAGNKDFLLVDKHFSIASTPDFRKSIEFIRSIYLHMNTIFARPNIFGGSTGAEIIDADRKDRNWYGYTYLGGWFRGGEKKASGERMDSIYLSAVLDKTAANDDWFIATILHELAHYVGDTKPFSGIKDLAYGLPGSDKISHLTPSQKMHNAQSYEHFAFEAGLGRDDPAA